MNDGDGHSDEGFESWRSLRDFEREVMSDWRYERSPKSQRFLTAVAAGSRRRASEVPKDSQFFRAQVAHDDRFDARVGVALPEPALPERMIPLRNRASEGRVNPKGIPCLYVASDEHTAMAEARPWIGSLVSVGRFKTRRPLKIVDCTKNANRTPIFLEEPTASERIEAVWSQIASAFREPVTRDDNTAAYAATQVIAEVFRKEGFDGLAYRSAFGTDRFNIALFDLDAVEITMCSLHEIRDVQLKHSEVANPYFVRKDESGGQELVQNVIVGFSPADPDEPNS